MVIRSEGAVEYVMVGVSRRPTQAIWRGKEIEPVQVIVMSFDPVKIVVASELKQFEFNGIEITGFICKIIKKENRGETVSINMNFSIMMNCPTDRETDGRELCLKDRVKILNFKEICFKGRPRKNTHGETNIGIDFGSVSIHFPLRWALESINGKGKKIGKDLMKRNKRVQFRSWDKAWKEIVPVVPKLEFKVERANNNMNGGMPDRILRASVGEVL
ncbi:hypothetical protein TNCV_2852951 [Trichonephila clavipes]|uniref:Uncharacterized protein n=1 Tax=Trichonephila clavipes TaxID=2585209 RepID=A0A8X6REL4_TRICX|nr:hypothetical protein TNCV_2852951 [Trichonephila clavipes]